MSFIPRDIYPAVMFARAMMRDGTAVGLSVYKASKYYGVDQTEVAQWLNGKKKSTPKTAKKNMKYCWYVVYVSCDATGEWDIESKNIIQTDNRFNYSKKLERDCLNRSRRNDTGSNYSPFYSYTIAPKLYATKSEAQNELEKFISQEWGEML